MKSKVLELLPAAVGVVNILMIKQEVSKKPVSLCSHPIAAWNKVMLSQRPKWFRNCSFGRNIPELMKPRENESCFCALCVHFNQNYGDGSLTGNSGREYRKEEGERERNCLWALHALFFCTLQNIFSKKMPNAHRLYEQCR